MKEAAPMGHVCALHKGLRSPLIPFRYGRTSSGRERMEVGKEKRKNKQKIQTKTTKKTPKRGAHTQRSGAALLPARSLPRRLPPITAGSIPSRRAPGSTAGSGASRQRARRRPAPPGAGERRRGEPSLSPQLHTEPRAEGNISCRTPRPATSSPSASFDALKKGLMGPSSAPRACSSEGVGVGGREPKEEGWGKKDLPNRGFSHICVQCDPY